MSELHEAHRDGTGRSIHVRLVTAAAADSQVVLRLPLPGALSQDDGVQAQPWRFDYSASVPGNAVPLSGFVFSSRGSALVLLQPTSGVPLGGGVELSLARSASSDDGRGLGGGGQGLEPRSSSLSLILLLESNLGPAGLRAAQRTAIYSPIAQSLPGCDGGLATAWPGLPALPPEVHLSALGADGRGGLAAMLHHLGEPGEPAWANGGGEVLQAGEWATVAWKIEERRTAAGAG